MGHSTQAPTPMTISAPKISTPPMRNSVRTDRLKLRHQGNLPSRQDARKPSGCEMIKRDKWNRSQSGTVRRVHETIGKPLPDLAFKQREGFIMCLNATSTTET